MRKAQSPYSVNTLAALAARAAVQDREYVDEYVAEVLAARELVYEGLEAPGHPLLSRARRTSCCSTRATARSRFATRCASAACWCATAAMKFPDASASPSAPATQIERFLAELERLWTRLIVFDMDGVLAEVTESYREAIVQTVEHFTGKRITRELIQEYKNRGRLE